MSRSAKEISEMFSEISGRYDLANAILSLGLDRGWRRALIKAAQPNPGQKLLDLCTGTADLILEFSRQQPELLAIGVDLSSGMLQAGQAKIASANLSCTPLLIEGDALELPFADETFDIISVAFGLRNLTHIHDGLREMARVLTPGGRLLILEFSLPENHIWRKIYLFYLKNILPKMGGWISKSRLAYQYLHDSICSFPSPVEVLQELQHAGLRNANSKKLLGGVAFLYTAEKL